MIHLRFETTIDRLPAEVWSYASDLSRHTEWMEVESSELLSGRADEVGGRARQVLRIGPARVAFDLVITEAVPGKRLRWQIEEGAALAGGAGLELAPTASGATRAVYDVQLGLRGRLRLLEPILGLVARPSEAAELQRLKRRLEAASASPVERPSASEAGDGSAPITIRGAGG